MLLRSVLLTLVCLSCSPAAGIGRPKVPDEPVIQSYTPDMAEASSAEAKSSPGKAQGVGSTPINDFTRRDLARLQIVSSGYPRTLRQINEVLAYIIARSPVPALRPEVKLFYGLKPEARAISSELIVISTGYLDMLSKEIQDPKMVADGIAFLLAHEYAHLLYDHPRTYPQKERGTIISDDVQRGFQVIHQLQTVDRQLTGENRKAYVKAQGALMGVSVASPWIEAELFRFVYAPYVKREEQRADYLATDLLSDESIGPLVYDAAAGASLFRSIYKPYDDSLRKKLADMGKAARATTVDASKQVAAAAPAILFDGLDLGAVVRRSLLTNALPRLMKAAVGRLRRGNVHLYFSSDKRVDAIDKYALAFYPAAEEEFDADLIAAFDLNSVYEQERTADSAAERALEFLLRNDIEGARNALDSVASDKSAGSSLQYVLASAAVSFAEGKVADSIMWYRRAIRRPEQDAPADAYASLAKAHFRIGNSEKAIQSLELGAKRFTVPQFILQKIELLVQIEDSERTVKALEECKSEEDDSLYARCEVLANELLNPPAEELNEGNRVQNLGRSIRDRLPGGRRPKSEEKPTSSDE